MNHACRNWCFDRFRQDTRSFKNFTIQCIGKRMKIQKWFKQKSIEQGGTNPSWLDPNECIDGGNIFWFWFALGLLVFALIIGLNLGGDETKWVGGKEISLIQLIPDFISAILSTFFMAALFIRKCIKVPEHPLIWLLIIGDLILFASFFNVIFSGEDVVLFEMPNWWPFKDPSIKPRFLACAILMLTVIGARPIAGLAAILLAFVTLIKLQMVNESLGAKGMIYVFSSFVSLVVQTRIPGIGFDAIRSRQFLSDAGSVVKMVGGDLVKSIQSTGNAAKNVASAATKAAMAYATGGISLVAEQMSQKSKTENTELLNKIEEKKDE